jgi:heterotetrameric sarcosine oxidase gamma subunit
VVNLIAKTPLWGQEPVELGGVVLAEQALRPITSIAPFDLPAAAALGFPAPNTVLASNGGRLVWTGRDQAFLIGSEAGRWAETAALTDQSDGWACMALTGAGAVDVLARLVPIDLRAMGVGGCARTTLGHMSLIVIGVEAGFQLMVFRSMAKTAWHELETAMKLRKARLGC